MRNKTEKKKKKTLKLRHFQLPCNRDVLLWDEENDVKTDKKNSRH
jgi:hypothetical protein